MLTVLAASRRLRSQRVLWLLEELGVPYEIKPPSRAGAPPVLARFQALTRGASAQQVYR